MRLSLLSASLAFLVSTPALAQQGDAAVADAIGCQAVRGAKARLSCFEAAVSGLREAFPDATALVADRAAAARAAAIKQETDEFGLFEREEKSSSTDYEKDAFGTNDLPTVAGGDDDEVKSVNGIAIEIGKNNAGKIFVVLDNGQVWRQITGDKSTPYIPRKAEGLPVVIKKGLMGSYFIKVGNAKDAFKAQRIK
ncbi:MAG: hypothetical protein A3E78_05735 [Alphaproteobacteria bacterium RIFCSPHIGHO2_12_FULL_63_12]|nr:MAG: hypothetical protein A3E78_05735 [Alphaproteobacteria bacterium RIFCSPHIGHO2_12_FULL_63_12]